MAERMNHDKMRRAFEVPGPEEHPGAAPLEPEQHEPIPGERDRSTLTPPEARSSERKVTHE